MSDEPAEPPTGFALFRQWIDHAPVVKAVQSPLNFFALALALVGGVFLGSFGVLGFSSVSNEAKVGAFVLVLVLAAGLLIYLTERVTKLVRENPRGLTYTRTEHVQMHMWEYAGSPERLRSVREIESLVAGPANALPPGQPSNAPTDGTGSPTEPGQA